MGTACLAIAVFLNPFGFDLIVYKLTQLTQSYWVTMYIMYGLAVAFFGLFLFFNNINPFSYLVNKVKKIRLYFKNTFSNE